MVGGCCGTGPDHIKAIAVLKAQINNTIGCRIFLDDAKCFLHAFGKKNFELAFLHCATKAFAPRPVIITNQQRPVAFEYFRFVVHVAHSGVLS